ncbi:phage tail spike protein [uncultured Streptococcus sp.]|uniref:phage tail spike protein n=1 Tax=uncultured Streptococcus sp. TaxID=83427 RepID=UPI0028D296CE|nr:phage tail spike protein [uncultured Streptococcus sp.]
MIYLTEGNTPLNEAYNDEIVQERNNTYQLTFRFPTSDSKWELLKEETFLTADDLHGEQDFYIFEVEKQQGYIQVYANQVISLLNNYIVSSIDVDRVSGTRVLSALAGSITRANPFSFFSDIDDRHTFSIKDKNAMEVLAKDKHSILGQWGGDMVRNGYNLRLLKNGGSENESLFMYKKNLSSYQHKTSTKSLKTRITFKTTVKGEGEKAPDVDYVVVIDSPLLGKYSQIYEAVVEVNDQNVKDQSSLIEYGKQYFRTSMCDMLEDNLEISVVGQSDVAVRMFDVVSIYHEWYGLDVRKKITKYTYSPMAKRLKSIGFGTFQSSLANAIGGIVNDAVLNESRNLHQIFDERLKKEIANADRAFDAEFAKREKAITDAIEQYKAKAEEVKQDISNEIDKRFQNFDNASIQEARRKAEEALRSAGASSSLAQEAKTIADQASAKMNQFKQESSKDQRDLSENVNRFKSELQQSLAGKADNATVEQTERVLRQKFESLSTDTLGKINAAKTEFEKTAQGLSTKITNVETYVNNDGQRQDDLKRYVREESASQASAIRERISQDYVGKSAYQEDVKGLERRFSAISTQTDNDIATKIAQYKQTVDGQFASIISQMAGKVNQTDFQSVQETSKLYERIIGRNENDIADKVARMALTNQLFQVEVSKYSRQGGPNLIKNSGNPQDNKNWGYWEPGQNPAIYTGTHTFFYNEKRKLFFFENNTRKAVPVSTIRFPLKRNTDYTLSLTAFNTWNMKGATIFFLGRKSGENQAFTRVVPLVENVKFSSDEAVRKNYTFNSGECDEGFIRIDNNGTTDSNVAILLFGDVDVYEGTTIRPWQPSPEDTNEAVRSVQSQLAGSWAVQNINSAGDIISGINLGANGHNRLDGKLTHITGETLIDNAVIKSAMVDKLKTANFEAGSVTTTILNAEAVTADKVRFDDAFIRKMIANEAFIDQLTSKRIFATKIESVITSSTVLEGYKGWIGGFQLGTHDSGSGRWLTGRNHFSVGMGDGEGGSGRTALWVNWGYDWNSPGYYAWFVKNNGSMYCYNTAEFWRTPIIHGDLKVTGRIFYDGGTWIYSGEYEKIGRSSKDYFYLEKASGARDWFPAWNDTSDRRLKSNIQESSVSGVDVINHLKTYSYRKEFNNEVEDISCGIMAQDVQKYAPDAFREAPDGIYTYNTFALVPYLIKAIQELNQKIEKMEETIA